MGIGSVSNSSLILTGALARWLVSETVLEPFQRFILLAAPKTVETVHLILWNTKSPG